MGAWDVAPRALPQAFPTFLPPSPSRSTVAMSGYVNVSLPQLAPVLVVLDGQTGALRFKAGGDGSVKYGGPVQVTEHGTWIAWTDGDSVTVLSGATGAVRDTVAMKCVKLRGLMRTCACSERASRTQPLAAASLCPPFLLSRVH